MFLERADAAVLHEPFSHACYHGPDRLSDRFADLAPRPEHAYEAVAAEVSATCEAPILFMKDMADRAKPVGEVDVTPQRWISVSSTVAIRKPSVAPFAARAGATGRARFRRGSAAPEP